MSPLEEAALAWVRADDAYAAACARYRAYVGRDDLEQKTPEEKEWWDEHVVPAMQATWPARWHLVEVARQINVQLSAPSAAVQP